MKSTKLWVFIAIVSILLNVVLLGQLESSREAISVKRESLSIMQKVLHDLQREHISLLQKHHAIVNSDNTDHKTTTRERTLTSDEIPHPDDRQNPRVTTHEGRLDSSRRDR